MSICEIYEKTVKIIRCDGFICRVTIRKNIASPSHIFFYVTGLSASYNFDYIFKRYPMGDYYWIDSPFSPAQRIRIRELFPAWDLKKFAAARDGEVIR